MHKSATSYYYYAANTTMADHDRGDSRRKRGYEKEDMKKEIWQLLLYMHTVYLKAYQWDNKRQKTVTNKNGS